MPATINKQRVVTQLLTVIKKRYAPPEPEERPVLEQLLYAICREGATREQGDRAYRALQEKFFDWNEIRVSSAREVEECFEDMDNTEARAQRVIALLQEVFETTFSFDLEFLRKKGLKQAAKQLGRYQAANDYAIAWVVQQSLGGHAVPLDDAGVRVLRRLGLADEEDLETLRTSLEHFVPKARGALFNELLSHIASEFCWDDEPNCSACPMCSDCSTGQDAKSNGNGERARPKPR